MHPNFIFFDFGLPDSLSYVSWALNDNFANNTDYWNILSLNLID